MNIQFLAPIPSISTTAPLVMGNYTIFNGSSVDFSAGNSGQFYEWTIDDGANSNTYSGSGLQNLINVPFDDCGSYTISLNYINECCGQSTNMTATLLLHVISSTYPEFIFTGADITNPNDALNADNWQNNCLPPANDPNVNITILSGATFNATGTLIGDVINYGTLKGIFTMNGSLTNFGVLRPGN